MTTEEQLAMFCRNIRYLRTHHKSTQKEMAQILEISVSRLRKMESGVYPPGTSLSAWINACNYFDLPPSLLVSVDLSAL